MTRKDIKREVHAVLIEMDVPPKSITDTASFQKDLGLDSLDFAEMVLQCEMRIQLDIPITEIEDLATVQQIVDYLYVMYKEKLPTH